MACGKCEGPALTTYIPAYLPTYLNMKMKPETTYLPTYLKVEKKPELTGWSSVLSQPFPR